MITLNRVSMEKKHFISKVELHGLKARKPKKFKVDLHLHLCRQQIFVSLYFANPNPNWDNMSLSFLSLPDNLVPKFYISSSCFARQADEEEDCGRVFTQALEKVLTDSDNTKIIITKRDGGVYVKLIMGKYESEEVMNESKWADYLFESL